MKTLSSSNTFNFIHQSFIPCNCNPSSSSSSSSSSSYSPPVEVIQSKIRSMILKKPRPPIKKFNQFLHPLMKEKNFCKAFTIGKYLIYNHKCYDEFTINVTMNSMCRLWFVENAVSCLSLFVKSGLEIDTVSVTTHIKGFAINNPSEGFQFANYLSMKNIPDTMNEITVGTLIIVIVCMICMVFVKLEGSLRISKKGFMKASTPMLLCTEP